MSVSNVIQLSCGGGCDSWFLFAHTKDDLINRYSFKSTCLHTSNLHSFRYLFCRTFVSARHILFDFLIVCASRISHTLHRMCKHSNGFVQMQARPGSLRWLASHRSSLAQFIPLRITFQYVQYVQCINMVPATTVAARKKKCNINWDIVLSRARVDLVNKVKKSCNWIDCNMNYITNARRNVIREIFARRRCKVLQSDSLQFIRSIETIDRSTVSCGHRMSKCFGRWSPIQNKNHT